MYISLKGPVGLFFICDRGGDTYQESKNGCSPILMRLVPEPWRDKQKELVLSLALTLTQDRNHFGGKEVNDEMGVLSGKICKSSGVTQCPPEPSGHIKPKISPV